MAVLPESFIVTTLKTATDSLDLVTAVLPLSLKDKFLVIKEYEMVTKYFRQKCLLRQW